MRLYFYFPRFILLSSFYVIFQFHKLFEYLLICNHWCRNIEHKDVNVENYEILQTKDWMHDWLWTLKLPNAKKNWKWVSKLMGRILQNGKNSNWLRNMKAWLNNWCKEEELERIMNEVLNPFYLVLSVSYYRI